LAAKEEYNDKVVAKGSSRWYQRTAILQRAKSQAEKTKQRMQLLKKQLEEQQMKECTFVPKTLRQKERRHFQDFLKDQQQYLEKRRESLRKMIEQNKTKEEQSIMSVPRINEQSKPIEVNEPVHERLFSKSKKIAVNQERKVEKKRSVKGTPREFSLYEEAEQRQKRLEERIRKEHFMSNRPIKEYSKDPFIRQKFSKEFNQIINSIEIINSLLTFTQMSNTLFNLNRGSIGSVKVC